MRKKALLSFLTLILVLGLGAATARSQSISGLIYHDADRSARSHYAQELGEEDVGLAGVGVALWDGAEEISALSSSTGVFVFADLGPGSYFLDYDLAPDIPSTSHNRPLRVPQALRAGELRIVAIGDSIGVCCAERRYPERLAEHFTDLAEVSLTNLHVDGSTSWEWLPGAEEGFFNELLAPLLLETDLVTITLGGNDLSIYAEGPPYDPLEILQAFLEHPEYLFEIIPNILAILREIRSINPNCDALYVLYPNFANSTVWMDLTPGFHPLVVWLLDQVLSLQRRLVGMVEGVIITDTMGALGDAWLDEYLIDEVHPSEAGHQLYADLIFETLGGVLLGEEPIGEDRLLGFFAPELIPADDDTGDDDTGDDDDDSAPDDDDDEEDDSDDDSHGESPDEGENTDPSAHSASSGQASSGQAEDEGCCGC